MTRIEVKTHNEYLVSIKDLVSDIDIKMAKWDTILNYFLNNSETVYFLGLRINLKDEEFKQTILYLSEEELFSERDDQKILFRIKPSSVAINRSLLSKLWYYYEYPSLIFLNDKSQEDNLLDMCKETNYLNDITKLINDITILYRSIEQDVLWISSNCDLKYLP